MNYYLLHKIMQLSQKNKGGELHQFSSNFSYGDAISNYMRRIRLSLIENGVESRIFSAHADDRSMKDFNFYSYYKGNKENTILIHASTYSPVLDFVKDLPDRKVLIYHNITPAHFFDGWNEKFADLSRRGIEQVKGLKDYVDEAYGVSEYNKNDLLDLGFVDASVWPITLDFEAFNGKCNKGLLSELLIGGVKNILFVGRFAPNKKHDDILKAFYIYNKYFETNSRLILVGGHDGMEKYYGSILGMIRELGLEEKVLLPGLVTFEDLLSYYRTADLFLSMSEHEGFFVPALESFYMGLPVLAYNSSAVAETVACHGVLFDEKDFLKVAEMMDGLVRKFVET